MPVPAQPGSQEPFLQEIATVFTAADGLPDTIFTAIRSAGSGQILAISAAGTYLFDGKTWKIHPESSGQPAEERQGSSKGVLSTAELGQQVFVGKEEGLFTRGDGTEEWVEVFPADGKYSWKLSHVSVMLADSRDRLWFGSDQGAGYYHRGRWQLYTGKEGLPYRHFTCMAEGADGQIWFGTRKGAIRTDGDRFFYRFSRRWLPDDHVNDILVEEDGTTWLATGKGVSRIAFRAMTLEEKADLFTEQVETRHNRMGFICQNSLKERYDAGSWEPAISDNDGMYTAKYGAAQAFRYAVTGDPEARRLAKRSFDACKWLVDITHEKGFPARVIVPVDWPEPVNEQYGHEYNMRKQQEDPFWKDIVPRFVTSRDGKYLWKCDASSDELAGHYFFYGIYYDLVADTQAEKRLVREVVGDITDHLIRHGFCLQDHDGKPTRWANFSPEFFNSVWGWDQRGLNSMMMLSFLNVAHHVTGDEKYLETAQMLRDRHHYHINAMLSKMYFPPEDVVPWDNNLCLMSMYGLLNYETDPELIMMYRESMEIAWLHISQQKSAFWNVLYAAQAMKFNDLVDSGVYSTGRYFPEAGPYAEFTAGELYRTDFRMEDILETLQRLPLDLIGYRMDNRHRLDIVFDPTPGQVVQEGWRPQNPERPDNTFELASEHTRKMGWHVDGKALPIDERCHVRLDRNGFVLDATEGSGYSEHEGTIYLLPYYMARYHGLIQ
jgi:hypothetical protein